MADQPSLIPSAWAANNSTTETIPATTSESGKASWDQGFPVETSLPLSEGGIPPKYGDFNGILNVLSQFCLFAQAGGQFTWSSTLAYSVGSIVVGSDGSIYRAVQATTNVNPVGDTSGKWERIVSQSDITALEADIQTAMSDAANAVSNASAAQSAVTTLDANVVKLSGNQEVGGQKTFTSGPKIQNNYPIFALDKVNDTQNVNPSDIRFTINGDNEAVIRLTNNKSLQIGTKSGTSGWSSGPLFMLESGGDFVCRAQNSTTGTSLRGKPTGELTWGGKTIINGSDNQTVGGVKTFSGGTLIINGTTKPQTLYQHSTLVKGTGLASQQGIDFEDKNGVSIGAIWQQTNAYNANYMRFIVNDIRTASATGSSSVCLRYNNDGATMFHPWGNNVIDLGSSSDRWKNTYLVTNPNVSSDERVKTSISVIPDDILDAWADVNWSQFQMNDAVEEKGINNARLHTGLIAQRIDEVFTAHGLDAARYGLFCHDVWDAQQEERDKNGVVTQEARDVGDMYSLRYTEALAMEAAYQRRRADRAEARITALERRLNEMEAVLASLLSPVGDETYAEPEQEQDAEQEGEE